MSGKPGTSDGAAPTVGREAAGAAADALPAFRDKLAFVLGHPLMADDPVAAAIMVQMRRGMDPDAMADLFARLSDRALDLAYEKHGAAAVKARRGLDNGRAAADEEAEEPLRLLLRL